MRQQQPRDNPCGADNEQGSPTATDLAWLAGHFDGDGWVGLVRAKRTTTQYIRYSAAAMIATTSKRIVDRIDSILTALEITHFVYTVPEKKVIRADGTESMHRRKWNISVRSNTMAKKLLLLIRPYLVEKGIQADIVIEYVDWRATLPRNPGRYGDGVSTAIQEMGELTMQRLREDRQRDDPSETARLAPATNGVMTQSELHGDVESAAEMTAPLAHPGER